MNNIIIERLSSIYGTDTKVIRTGSRLFGNIDENNWVNVVNPPLNSEEIHQFENEMKLVFPKAYKKLLSLMNGSILAGLVRIAGTPKIKGISIQEQYYQPFDLISFQQLYFSKKMPDTYFVFADSMSLGTIYAINEENRVLELHSRNKKVLRNLGTMVGFIITRSRSYKLLIGLLND
ncbi:MULTISPECIES: SMI1/KNR4 family protein [Bacillus]|mgnify:CR=1 FL=1|uniref:SMI1/KNR4 family protein n=1 Tax=Bacillus TaxID=1386 RepID=UPI001F0A98B2|nr:MULTISPECIES: SMI1/KNR4 family protein [Bacillus cereus group]MEC3155152.1 SMI1/KNR4 family protein [Bacillus thuringiensis]